MSSSLLQTAVLLCPCIISASFGSDEFMRCFSLSIIVCPLNLLALDVAGGDMGKFRNPDSLRLTSLRRAFLLADCCRRRCLLEGVPRLERRSRPDLDRGLRPVSGRVSKVGSGVPAWVLLFEPVALGVWCDMFVFGCVCRLLSQSSRLLICFSLSLK